MFSVFGGTETRRLPGASQFPWKKLGLVLLATALITIIILTTPRVQDFISRVTAPNIPAPAQSAQTEVIVPAVPVVVPAVVDVQNPVQNTQPRVAVPATLKLEWVEIAHKVRNGEEVLALPIPWDAITKDVRGTAHAKYIPDGVDPVIDFIRRGNYNLPPASTATSAVRGYPFSKVAAYLREGDKIILWGYSDYYWSVEDPQGVTYWRAEVLASQVEGQSP